MVTLKNTSGALRVVYDATMKMRAIPPNGSLEVALDETTLTRIRDAEAKGDKLQIVAGDPFAKGAKAIKVRPVGPNGDASKLPADKPTAKVRPVTQRVRAKRPANSNAAA